MNVKEVILGEQCDLRSYGKRDWILLVPFQTKVIFEEAVEEWIIVPAGFITDLASVPRIPFVYMMFGNKARRSALVHDYLYRTGRNRRFADNVFYVAMRKEESAFTRGAMYLGVRLGGWISWRGKPSNGLTSYRNIK